MIDFLTNNWVNILSLIFSILTLIILIVKMTPTNKDDEKLKKITGKMVSLFNLLTKATPTDKDDKAMKKAEEILQDLGFLDKENK